MTEPTAAPRTSRVAGLDIIKILAAFLVVCIHFFLYSGFYYQPMNQVHNADTLAFLRWTAYCCVPLFMITTGYLMKNKKLSKQYYSGIIRVLALYLVISAACIIFDIHHFHKEYTAWTILKSLFMFTGAQYAWYVEYYVSIFLLAPFMNLAWNGLNTRNAKTVMLISVLALSILGESVYIGTTKDTQIRLFPYYFQRVYPFAYYFIGAYIRDFPPKRDASTKMLWGTLAAVALFYLTWSSYRHSITNAEGEYHFTSWHYNDYGSWPVALASTMIFLLLFDIRIQNRIVTAILKLVSESAFACYLISYIFDTIFYFKHSAAYPDFADRVTHAPLVIVKIFLCSMGCGIVLQLLFDLFSRLIRKAIAKKNAKKAVLDTAAEQADAALPEEHTVRSEEITETAEELTGTAEIANAEEITEAAELTSAEEVTEAEAAENAE